MSDYYYKRPKYIIKITKNRYSGKKQEQRLAFVGDKAFKWVSILSLIVAVALLIVVFAVM
jgi:hypothetical protein